MTSSERPSLDELAAGAIDDTDVRTLERMAQMYAMLDPVPAGLVERVQFGITLDALHAEIAELQRSADLVGVRSDDTTSAHTITFTSASLSMMVTVTPTSADRVRVDGWVAPGAGVIVALRSADGDFSVTADEDGRFVFEEVPRGLAQFTVRQTDGADRPSVITPSIEI